MKRIRSRVAIKISLLPLLFGLFSAEAALGQDILSSSAIVLPQYPTSSTYNVSSGQTVNIISEQSVTLTPGAWLQAGSNVSIRIKRTFLISPPPANPDANLQMNWVYTRDFDEDGNIIGESKSFSDRFGNPLQNQVKSISTSHVLASQPIYDSFGRSVGQTLVAPTNNSEFNYKANFASTSTGAAYDYKNFDLSKVNNPDAMGNTAIGTVGWFYSNNNAVEPYVATTGFPYSRNDFYGDGTGMIKRSAGVGDQLRMGTGKEVSAYTASVSNELDHYLQVRNKFFSSTVIGERPTLIRDQSNQSIFHDANDREAVSIADRSGNILMTARPGNDLVVTNYVTMVPGSKEVHYFNLLANTSVNKTKGTSWQLYNMSGNEQTISITGTINKGFYKMVASGAPGDTLKFNYNNGYTDISYSFYNQSGQLIATIAPNGVKKLLADGLSAYADLASVPFVTRYEYDLRGRITANEQPDAGRTEFIYRKNGSARFSQNSVQRAASPKRFSYTNYDRWGRAVESGEFTETSTIKFSTAKADTSLQQSIASDGGLTGGVKLSVVKTQYDLSNNTHGVTGYIQDEGFLKGNVSYTENTSAKTWYNYDGEGRISWLIKQVSGLGNKTIDYTYDASGNLAKIDFQKNIPGERFIHEYEYDADNRLKVAYTSTVPGSRKEQARYYYYVHGPLRRVELAESLQGIDYVYTVDGQLKSINHPLIGTDPGLDGLGTNMSQDVFGMTLEYFSGDYTRNGTDISSIGVGGTADFSGSIMGQSWRSKKPQAVIATYGTTVDDPVMMTYAYDAKYQFNSNKFGVPVFASNSFTETLNANKEHSITYDANGNITALKRNNSAGSAIANYTYNYVTGSNKLSSVSGYATYTYDALGQMATQVRTAGNQGYYLDYDVNGKVTAIYSNSAKTTLRVSFAYDENGKRIRKTDHVQNTTTYYVYDLAGNMLAIYDNAGGTLGQKELPIYAASRVGMYDRPSNSYKYELTDNLGNVRVVINGTKLSNGEADVVYYSDYYPFGSPLTLATNDYRYGYQGQYAEVDKETGWNNFDLRMYDAEIGRWMTTDPYGQYHSPYLAMGNNPIMKVDPDGGCDDCPKGNYEKIGEDFYKGNLDQVNITAPRLTDHQVYADRMERYHGDLSQVFSGRRGAAIESWFNRQTYAYSLNMENEFQHGINFAVSSYATAEVGGALLGKAFDFGKAAYLSRLASRSSGIVVEADLATGSSTSLWPAASGGRTVVNGIEYTTHALERMQPVGTIMKGASSYSRGIPPSVVENAIKFGEVTPGNTAAEVVRTFENVRVITNPEGTRVISVFKIGN